MATKFSSCSLAVRYRMIHADGSASGGPMYYLERGLKLRWLAIVFALFAGVAHVPLAIKARKLYNPGLLVSLVLNIPGGAAVVCELMERVCAVQQ